MNNAYRIGEGYGSSALYLDRHTWPALSTGQVMVEVKAVSLNYRDTLVVNGIWKPPVGRIPVSDGVGIITAVGSHVKNLRVGDRVAGLFFPQWLSGRIAGEKLSGSLGGTSREGMLQQFVLFDENEVIVVPGYLTNLEAATLPCSALAAWNALCEQGNISPGDTVLIQGTGNVSLFALQFARMLGAKPIVLSSSDEKIEKLKKFGVELFVNYRKNPSWENKLMNLTNGKGVDHIVEVMGGDHVNRSITTVATGGTISLLGLMSGGTGKLNTEAIMEKNIRIQGVVVGSKEMFTNMNKALEAHEIHPVIDRVFSFDAARDALVYLEKGGQMGKICIEF